MAAPTKASEILQRHFLEVRCGLLDIAAVLDRLERAGEFSGLEDDPRLNKLREGIGLLATPGSDRAERIQRLFSDDYEPGWRTA